MVVSSQTEPRHACFVADNGDQHLPVHFSVVMEAIDNAIVCFDNGGQSQHNFLADNGDQ